MTPKRDQPGGLDPLQCYWCPRPAGSREDLFPRWLNKVTLDVPAGHSPGRIRLTRSTPFGAKTEIVEQIATKKTAVPGVCERHCNNGWMSVLENETRDVLVPMINGRRVILTLADQVQIARWACMKTGAFEADTRAEVGGLTSPSTRAAIYSGSLPMDMAVTLSAYDVALTFRALRPFAYGFGENHQPLAQFLTTWVLGHLVVQVVGRTGTIHPSVLEQAPSGILTNTRFSVWPPQPASVEWPPPQVLDALALPEACIGPFDEFRASVEQSFGDSVPRSPICPDCGTEHPPITRLLPVS